MIEHLRGPNHAHQLVSTWEIETWSYEELRSVHDDLHERYDTGTQSAPRKSQVNSFLNGRPKF